MPDVLRVLIAEDEKPFRAYLRALLQRYPWVEICGEARDGEEALALIAERRPDLILADINMPTMNGLEMLERVRETDDAPMAVLITGYDKFEYARRAIRMDVVDYLLKPFTEEELANCLQKVRELARARRASGKGEPDASPPDGDLPAACVAALERAVGKPNKSHSLLQKSLEYMQKNLGNSDITIETIAAAMYVSSSYLRKVYQNELCRTVMGILSEIRMNRAKRLIREGGVRLSDIASTVGFSDPAYFSRSFKKHTGLTPSAYEETARRNPSK